MKFAKFHKKVLSTRVHTIIRVRVQTNKLLCRSKREGARTLTEALFSFNAYKFKVKTHSKLICKKS